MRCNSSCPLLIAAGDVMAASDNVTELSSDAVMQESCTVVSDVIGSSHMDELMSSSHDELHVTAPTVTEVTLVTDSQAHVAAAFPNKVQESIIVDSTNVPEIRRRAAATSASVDHSYITSLLSPNATVLGNPSVPGNTAVSANPTVSAAQTMSVQEYCRAFEQWTWQYYWWMQHVHWMTWAAYMSNPVYTPVSYIPSTSTQPAVTSAVPASRPVGLQPQQQPLLQPRGDNS